LRLYFDQKPWVSDSITIATDVIKKPAAPVTSAAQFDTKGRARKVFRYARAYYVAASNPGELSGAAHHDLVG
jgi:hypothetical protein